MDPVTLQALINGGSKVLAAAVQTPPAGPSISGTGPLTSTNVFGSFDVIAGGRGSTGGSRAPSASTAATATGADQFPEAVTGWLPWAIVGLLAVVVIARR